MRDSNRGKLGEKMPLVSVVMPVYNTPLSYLREAIESILQQTYADFEFIIIDDHSYEETAAYLDSIGDERIRILRNPVNMGITKSLNKGFSVSTGEYIARMDADDIAVSTRLEKQVRFMESNPDVIVCGSAVKQLTDKGESILRWPQIDMEEFRASLLFWNCGPRHPSVMFRSALLKKYQITYDEQFPYAQDYDMWVTCLQYGKIRVMDEVLLSYRVHDRQVSRSELSKQRDCAEQVRVKQLERLIGPVSDQQKALHEGVIQMILKPSVSRKWLYYLKKQNRKTGIYDPKKFRKVVRQRQYSLKVRRYRQAKEKGQLPFLLAFILYTPLKYKVISFHSAINRIGKASD